MNTRPKTHYFYQTNNTIFFFFLMSYKVFLGLHNYHDQNGVQHVNVPGRNAFPMKGYDPVNIKNDMMLLKVCIYI